MNEAGSLPGGVLYLCATPIGNLRDVTLRVLDALAHADVVLAEDTRRTRKLLAHFGLTARPVSLHDHNERARTGEVLRWLESGKSVALVSDAGSPLIADPGFHLVRSVLAAGFRVVPLPGPSAAISGLMVSGLPPTPFLFLGFLPRKPGAKRRLLEFVARLPWTIVCYETPHRLQETLAVAVECLGGGRPAALARELTKAHEEVVRGSLEELRDRFSQVPPRGEFVLVIGGWEDGGVEVEE